MGSRPINLLYSLLRPPSPKYVTLEQLKAMWGTSPVPTAPAPGLPSWASASRDLVPTTCLPPVLPSSSSFASVTPSPQVGGLCVPATCGPWVVWLCVCFALWVWRPSCGLAPGVLSAWGLQLAAWRLAWHMSAVWELCRFSLPLARSWQLVSLYFLFMLSFLPPCLPFFPYLPVSLIMTFLYPSFNLPLSLPFSSSFLPCTFPSFLDLSSPSFPSCPRPPLHAPSRWRSCCSLL